MVCRVAARSRLWRCESGCSAAASPWAMRCWGVWVCGASSQVVAYDEALGERFVHGHGEAAAQLGESDEPQTQAVLAVHGEVGQQAKIFEDVVAQVLRLVDDEHGERLGLAHQSGDLGADGAVGGGARALGGKSQLPGDGLVHVEDVSGGEADVAHPIQARMQGGGDVAAHGGLARADLAGHEADALELDEVMQPCLGLAPGARLEPLVGVGRGLEGEPGEGEVAQVHDGLSLRVRIATGEDGTERSILVGDPTGEFRKQQGPSLATWASPPDKALRRASVQAPRGGTHPQTSSSASGSAPDPRRKPASSHPAPMHRIHGTMALREGFGLLRRRRHRERVRFRDRRDPDTLRTGAERGRYGGVR